MARVDRNLVGLWVALEHCDLAVGEFVLVLVDSRRGDHEQRLFVGERVGQETFAVHRASVFRDAAGPGRNRAIGIAGLLGTERCKAGAEKAGFLRRHRRHHVGGQQTQGQNGAQLQNHLAH
ncbi:hypothetical protein D3C81_1276480 [compost metagenome]